jgi:hypothetical protein
MSHSVKNTTLSLFYGWRYDRSMNPSLVELASNEEMQLYSLRLFHLLVASNTVKYLLLQGHEGQRQ